MDELWLNLLPTHPETKIHVFYTLSTGPELRLLMEKLIELDKSWLSFEEVCTQAETYRKHTRLFYSLQSVHNLAQNGRISKAVAAAITQKEAEYCWVWKSTES